MDLLDPAGSTLPASPPAHAATASEPVVESADSLVAEFAVPGFLGAALMAAGAVAVGWIAPASGLARAPVVEQLRTSPQLSLVGKLLVIVGVGLLLQTWLQLGHHVRTSVVTDAGRLGRLVWWWSAPLVFAPVLFSRDLFSYIAQSRLLPNGIDPYLYGTGVFPTFYTDGADALWKGAPAPYGPLWMGLSSGVYAVTRAEANLALLAFRLLALAGIALIAVYLPRLARACGADPAKAVWLGLLNPLVVMHFVSAGHNDALMLGLLVAGITLALEGRFGWGLLLVALGGAVKAPALLGLPFVAIAWAGTGAGLRRRAAGFVWVGAAALAVFLALDLVVGVNFGWLHALQTPGQVRSWLSATTAAGMVVGDLGRVLGLGYHLDGTIAFSRDVGTALTAALLAWLVLTPDRRPVARGLGLGLLGVVLLGPVVQTWYLLWGLVVLAGAGLSRAGTRAAVLLSVGFVVYSIASGGATVNAYGDLPDGLAALLAVLVVVALLLSSRRARALLLAERDWVPDREAQIVLPA